MLNTDAAFVSSCEFTRNTNSRIDRVVVQELNSIYLNMGIYNKQHSFWIMVMYNEFVSSSPVDFDRSSRNAQDR